MNSLPQSLLAHAAVVLVAPYQFTRNERIVQPRVKSRMLLWCKSGRGLVTVNGTACPLQPDDFLFLPWDRSIVYEPDPQVPFLVGSIHIIPFHDDRHRIMFGVAHTEQDAMSEWSWRKDRHIPVLHGIKRGSLAHTPALRHLAEYTLHRCAPNRTPDWEARSLGQLLLATVADYFLQEPLADTNVPPDLQQMILLVRTHARQSLSLADLARFSGRSPSYVGRLFRKHLRTSPVEFIHRAKMDCARQLLATSRRPIGEIGEEVGIADPYYFSKLFRKTVGCSPREYRQTAALL